jgi:uncharacterized protein YraI
MTIQQHETPARNRRARTLGALSVLIAGVISAVVMNAPAAMADPTVHTLGTGADEYWAPYQSNTIFSGFINANTNITISCYLTGDSVTGPYGAENVWDLVSGGSGVQVGSFVPDADIYTGSNSPVVPTCGTALGQTIGGNNVSMYSGPGTNYSYLGFVASGEKVEVKCYSTGTTVSGPYGSENIWDKITATSYGYAVWLPDALVYTGSNSAVVPHC